VLYTLTLYILLGVGLAASIGFLALHRPRRRFRITEVNSSGWVIIIGLIYARSLLLLGVRGASPPEPWWDVVLSLGLLAGTTALLLVRFFSYRRYLRDRPEPPPTAS
jgi:RsiW-degrading membrane proteinase PrsW (M82 family)